MKNTDGEVGHVRQEKQSSQLKCLELQLRHVKGRRSVMLGQSNIFQFCYCHFKSCRFIVLVNRKSKLSCAKLGQVRILVPFFGLLQKKHTFQHFDLKIGTMENMMLDFLSMVSTYNLNSCLNKYPLKFPGWRGSFWDTLYIF